MHPSNHRFLYKYPVFPYLHEPYLPKIFLTLHTHLLRWHIHRILGGFGGAGITVAGLALLMEISTTLERDLGIQEIIIGVGYTLGPTLGELLLLLLSIPY